LWQVNRLGCVTSQIYDKNGNMTSITDAENRSAIRAMHRLTMHRLTAGLGVVHPETDGSKRPGRIAVRRTDPEARSVDSPCQRGGNKSRTPGPETRSCSRHSIRRY
ncbi:MAG TPA: hypothetical protein PKA83_18550, partial [Pirellulaceae bacterium]|nr:hypothetical protein [Pirellulaceae bacterium]